MSRLPPQHAPDNWSHIANPCTIPYERACGPVAVLVFKTGERGDEPRWWVRLPRALANLIERIHSRGVIVWRLSER